MPEWLQPSPWWLGCGSWDWRADVMPPIATPQHHTKSKEAATGKQERKVGLPNISTGKTGRGQTKAHPLWAQQSCVAV